MTETYTLQRTYYADRTEGWLFLNDKEICVTMELPWDDNEPDKSCIPESTYAVVPHNTPDHPNVWEVTGVPGRTAVLIHNGNFASDSGRTDTLGCILVGSYFGMLNNQNVVLNSDETLIKLRLALPDTFYLQITENPTKETLPWIPAA